MTQDALGSPTTIVALDELLLDAKLSVPQPHPDSVSRAGLIQTARASDCRVVGLTAPAGYGKSTLLAQWARAEDRRVAWVSLDRFDDDPVALLTLLASAYARISPGDTDLVADMAGLTLSALGRSAPRLAAVLRSSPDPFVVMLDDLHELRSPVCHDVLSVVIAGIPRGSQLVAASRTEQPHLPRLRASGDVLEFGAGDLAFDPAGAEQIFSRAQVHLTREAAVAVTERTEGWPVGLYLAALIASESTSGAVAIDGDDRYVADYLYRESLMPLPEDQQRFLRRTAVLDHLSAPLCDAVLGEPGAPARLRSLEASSSFLIPLDRRREWFRYHGLFQEFLLGELRRVEPDLITKLHLRAADWYESNGSPAMAVEHLLHTSERDRCARLMTRLVLPTFWAGQVSTIQRWLSTLGDPAIVAYPPLAVFAGWITMFAGQASEAQRWAAFVDAASFDFVPADGSASFESLRSMLRAMMCPAGPERMLADASFAVAAEAPWSPWHYTAIALSAEAHLLSGDIDRATALFAEVSTMPAESSSTLARVVSQAELALLAMDRGRWAEAAEYSDLALAGVERNRLQDYPLCVLASAGAARLALRRGDLAEVTRHVAAAMRARPSLTVVLPIWAVRVRLQLAKVHWAIGEHTAARHLLLEIDDVLHHRPALGTLGDEVSEFRQTVASSPPSAATGGSPLTPAELRLLPYLQTHLTTRDIAERLFVSRSTVNTQISSIYRKLGVSSRTDAVQQATTIGLLGA